jgi:hypothetical protein
MIGGGPARRAGRPVNVAGPLRCRRYPGWSHRARDQPASGELIEFAIEELFRKHNAKRAFGDA